MTEYRVKVYKDRTEWYNLEGQLHREDGPAIEWGNGDKEWYLNGKLHREDGHAVEYVDGAKFWYLNGRQISEKEFNRISKTCEGREVEIEGRTYILKLK